MVMDSLRYWVEVMGVDGFRFDLTSSLARDHWKPEEKRLRLRLRLGLPRRGAPGPGAQQDQAHRRAVGPRGRRLPGRRLPAGWAEWNGKFRDTARRYWKGEPGHITELATRITGSADMLAHAGRRPSASVNLVTAHDGFTLHDLVSYNEKHNEANGEDNRDGINENDSWNCGVEGPTDDPEIVALRNRQKRNLLATLLLSQGVPQLLAGDELGNSQGGNNNAYCQDSDISWIRWDETDFGLLEFVSRWCAAPPAPGLPPPALLPRPADPRHPRSRTSSG
jgi:glycogen operon protein